MKRIHACTCSLLFALLERPSAAQAGPEPIRVDYSAPAACGDAARFFQALRARTAQFREAAEDEAARRFQVEVALRPEGATGRLTIREPAGEESVRTIEAEGCDQTIDGLALIAALAIDPHAAAATASAARKTEQAAPPTAPSAPTQDAPSGDAEKTAARPGPDPWAVHVALGGYALWAVAPAPLLGERVHVEVDRAVGTSNWLVPSARLSAQHAGRGGLSEPGGTAAFSLTAATLDLCPIRALLPAAFQLRPCLSAEFGALTAIGTDTVNPRSSTTTWFGLGGGAQIVWPCCQRWALNADLGFIFPLKRERFLFGPYAFHDVPAVVGAGTIGISVRLL